MTSIAASSSNVVACRGVRVFIIAEPSMMMTSASGSVSRIVACVSQMAASETSDKYSTSLSHLMQLGMIGSRAEIIPVSHTFCSGKRCRG